MAGIPTRIGVEIGRGEGPDERGIDFGDTRKRRFIQLELCHGVARLEVGILRFVSCAERGRPSGEGDGGLLRDGRCGWQKLGGSRM